MLFIINSIASAIATSDFLQHNLRNRVFSRVRDGKMSRRRARLFVKLERATMKRNQWRARFFGRDFDVLPRDPIAPAGLQGFQCGFFCGEASGIMLGGDDATRFAVRALSFSEHALSETRRALDGFAHAANFDNVDSD